MSVSVEGRVVIITGGARGLGREMALELADHGAQVIITATQASEAFAATTLALGKRGMGMITDVSDRQAVDDLLRAVLDRFGRIDAVVNNAGRGMRLISESFNTTPTKFWQASPDAWSRIMDINVNGAFYMARAVAPIMIAQQAGKIINISTSAQTMVRKGYSPYGPSKAALEAASRAWAQDLAGTGVDVNVYLPGGAADTDLLPPSADKKGADGKLLPPAIMRRAICWLVSAASDGVTGGRFIAAEWADDMAPAEAAGKARSDQAAPPIIM